MIGADIQTNFDKVFLHGKGSYEWPLPQRDATDGWTILEDGRPVLVYAFAAA
jgi:hypothetical protein